MARDFASSLIDLADGAISVIASMGPTGRRPDPERPASRGADTARRGESARPKDGGGASLVVARQHFRVVESTDAQTGAPCWVVTDGVDRAECSSAQLAQRVMVALG